VLGTPEINALVFALALGAALILIALLLATLGVSRFTLWPTPGKGSWQNYVFWPLFRTCMGLTPVLAVLSADFSSDTIGLQLALGLPLVIAGFGMTFYGYFDLGIENTYGTDDSLVTGGLYKYSRNPQYVASIVGYLGLAVASGAWQVWVMAACATLVYTLMTYAEEPWLRQAYGEQYEHYRQSVPRFIGPQSLVSLRDTLAGAGRGERP
jgi:protein-S-isoprenylcysteine O-methyltransferase Ste14